MKKTFLNYRKTFCKEIWSNDLVLILHFKTTYNIPVFRIWFISSFSSLGNLLLCHYISFSLHNFILSFYLFFIHFSSVFVFFIYLTILFISNLVFLFFSPSSFLPRPISLSLLLSFCFSVFFAVVLNVYLYFFPFVHFPFATWTWCDVMCRVVV